MKIILAIFAIGGKTIGAVVWWIFGGIVTIAGTLIGLFLRARLEEHKEMYNHYQQTKDEDFTSVVKGQEGIAATQKAISLTLKSLKSDQANAAKDDRRLANKQWDLNKKEQELNKEAILQKFNSFSSAMTSLFEMQSDMFVGERGEVNRAIEKIQVSIKDLDNKVYNIKGKQ